MKKMTTVLFAFFFITTLNAQTFPREDWTYNTNYETNGWDASKLKNYKQFLIDSTQITGLVIVHQGEIVFRYGDIKENSYIASCRKSILAMLYGKYVENGQIKLNKTLKELQIDDITELSELEKSTTINNIISARSGVFLRGSNLGDDRKYAPERNSKKPGTYWLYNNWDFNVAGFIFEKETGYNIYDEVEKQLAIPLHMQDWDRSLQRKRGDLTISKYPAYHMWFSTRDMARVGLLMLKKGKWQEKQLLSEKWVAEMTSQITTSTEVENNTLKSTDVDFGYGYMWWLWENITDNKFKGAYSAFGVYGQSITIYPEIDVVVAYKTKGIYGRSNDFGTQIKILKKAVNNFKNQ
ncbi:serine hydrolase [Flavobacteriaceae bacterium LYZ1037]|nr:serine hydrolase [Flavobacteriaceae bacterium LYZ1037]